jgi:hypothetical protein
MNTVVTHIIGTGTETKSSKLQIKDRKSNINYPRKVNCKEMKETGEKKTNEGKV